MYIVELFIKWLNKNKRGTSINPNNLYKENIGLNDAGEVITQTGESYTNCNHKFMPVDSTGKILACVNCGFVIKERD